MRPPERVCLLTFQYTRARVGGRADGDRALRRSGQRPREKLVELWRAQK